MKGVRNMLYIPLRFGEETITKKRPLCHFDSCTFWWSCNDDVSRLYFRSVFAEHLLYDSVVMLDRGHILFL